MSFPCIRILHVIESLGRGGAERQLVDVILSMDKTGYEHMICHLRGPDDLAEELRAKGHTVINLSMQTRRNWVLAAWKLRKVISKYRPHVIHTRLYDANISIRFTRLFGIRIPIVTSLECPDYDLDAVRAAGWPVMKVTLLKWLDLITTKWTDPLFVAVSSFVSESAQQHLMLSESQIRVIYNGVNTQRFSRERNGNTGLRSFLGIPHDAVVFLNVGRLDPQKGQMNLLQSFCKIVAQVDNAYLVIVGEGRVKQQLNNAIDKKGISDRVKLVGIQPHISSYFSMADIFVFPSLFEGLGIALIEAMICGLPCIASNIRPLDEVITHDLTGILVKPGEPDNIASAMLRFYHDREYRTVLGKRGQSDALEKFEIKNIVKEWEHLYRDIAQSKKGTLHVTCQRM